jgi:hypothetical protein
MAQGAPRAKYNGISAGQLGQLHLMPSLTSVSTNISGNQTKASRRNLLDRQDDDDTALERPNREWPGEKLAR